jgi:hypothetical protein
MLHSMPTLNPRLTITLTPACAAVLRELSTLTGNSQSATVGELLEMSLPVFERVVAGIKAAKSLEANAKSEIAEGLERAQHKVEAQLQIALADMDEGFRPLLTEAEKIQRRGASAPGRGWPRTGAGATRRGSTPVPVTRGSGHPGKPAEGSRKKARKGSTRGRV